MFKKIVIINYVIKFIFSVLWIRNEIINDLKKGKKFGIDRIIIEIPFAILFATTLPLIIYFMFFEQLKEKGYFHNISISETIIKKIFFITNKDLK